MPGHWSPLPVDQVASLLTGLPARWWFAGGHALELHVGRTWRAHDDVDVGIVREDAPRLAAHLRGWEIMVAAAGALSPWDGHRPLDPDRHENNLWCRQLGGPWLLDVLVGSGDGERWIDRRDATFTLPWSRAVRTSSTGLPYLAPDLQLLFKAKAPRPKDDVDAEVVIPTLGAGELAILHARLAREHPWRRRVRPHRRAVAASDVLEVLDLLEVADVPVWVDGGWAVDALLGQETREHADLDVAVPSRVFAAARSMLAGAGFALVRDDGPHNVVLADHRGRLVDVHAFDDAAPPVVGDDGIARHAGEGLAYEVDGFGGTGTVGGRDVRCIGAATLVRYHTGYEVDEDDWHDVRRLCLHVGLPVPADYARWSGAG